MRTCLLDLNWTLAANSKAVRSLSGEFARKIERERYDSALIDSLAGFDVWLITARPERYRITTLANIEMQTGWHPDQAFFNLDGSPPHICKERWLERSILQNARPSEFFALESNHSTRAMYKRHGIPAFTKEEWLNDNARTLALIADYPTGARVSTSAGSSAGIGRSAL